MEELLTSARELLHKLCGPTGIQASLSEEGNYRAVFTRDAVMAGLYGLWASDATISRGLVNTLEHLRELQGPNGQIASNFTYENGVDRHNGKPEHVSYGTLCPKPDALNWYLLGVAHCINAKLIDAMDFFPSVQRVLELMEAMEYNGKHLLYIPVGGNWADEYPYEGYLLHDQTLRLLAMQALAKAYDEPSWAVKAGRISETVSANLWPAEGTRGLHKRLHEKLAAAEGERTFFAAGLNPTGYLDYLDLASNTLMTFNPSTGPLGDRFLDFVEAEYLGRQELPPVFAPTIFEDDPDWPAIRDFYIYVFKNKPGHYHNGGVWFIWLGWLSMALKYNGRNDIAALLRENTHTVFEDLEEEFYFEEYLTGPGAERRNIPGGTQNMAYTATGLLMMELNEGIGLI